ncbi:MAG: hypothetical protein ABA06_04005 [Parcubacteria bacterium C7867-001]|nr:MAG: hypothetical protein ABA06_04005 [Parcubacteria bacterium C7867-001]
MGLNSAPHGSNEKFASRERVLARNTFQIELAQRYFGIMGDTAMFSWTDGGDNSLAARFAKYEETHEINYSKLSSEELDAVIKDMGLESSLRNEIVH